MASISTQRTRLSLINPQLPYFAINPWLQQNPPHRLRLRYSHSSKSHHRPSTSAQPNDKRVPSTSSTSSTPLANDVNPPPSTRPADLELPEPISPSASIGDKASHWIAYGRAFLSFYKTGLKNVYHNYRTSLPIRRSLGIPSYLPSSPPPKFFLKSGGAKNKYGDARTSRSTFQLLHRAAYDVRRMIPFTLILIICGELTPLLILAFGNAVTPYTCRIPKQIAKYRMQRTDRKRAALSAHSAAATGSVMPPKPGSNEELKLLSDFASGEFAKGASAEDVMRACAVFGLVKTHSRPVALVNLLYRPRLRKYAEYLALDDKLIRNCGGVSAMESAEVKVAIEERGGYGLPQEVEGWEAERLERRWLDLWLQRSK
ncbi:hypothetical protein BDW62DRAFT_48789 [Aspergillus aurantiobrunneus]